MIIFLLFVVSVTISADVKKYSYTKGKYKNAKIIPGKIIVKFAPQTGNIESSSELQKIRAVCPVEKIEPLFPNFVNQSTPKRKIIDLSRIYSIYISHALDPEAVCHQVSQLPGIIYAEPVVAFPVEMVPNDPYYPRQTYLPQIQMEEAWELAQGDSTVIVAIIDTGVDWDHPDLAINIWQNEDEIVDGIDNDQNGFIDDIRGWDFVNVPDNDFADGEDGKNADNNPMDFEGHGTACSGCVAAVTNNGIGVAGINWRCKIMPLRVGWRPAQGQGVIRMDWAALAFRYAGDNGAHAANLSTGSIPYVADAARYAFDRGVVITKSAGNTNDEETDPLDVAPYALTVAAVDDRDIKASYSSYGEWIKVSAPGGDQNSGRPGIYTTDFDNRYNNYQGTSFSAPITAGLAALIKSVHPDWTAGQITVQIVETADNIDQINPTYAGKLGSGRINAYRAITETATAHPKIKLLTYSVIDSTTGNGNGVVDIGERVQIAIELENSWGTANNLIAKLQIEDWAVQIEKGEADFGTLYGLENADLNRASNANEPFVVYIDSLALPHRIQASIVLTANSDYQAEFPFIMNIRPSILYVDDADIETVASFYISVLDQLGYSFDYWSHLDKGTPDNLSTYSSVIWSCEWTFPSLDEFDRAALTDYLNQGGSLFLSGQDIGWDLCDPDPDVEHEFLRSNGASKTFYEEYLKASYLLDDSEYSILYGVANDPIGDQLQFTVYQPGRESDFQFPDEVNPINGSLSIFDYPNGASGAVRYADDYRLVHFTCGGFEAITDSATRTIVMNRVLNWLNGLSVEHTPLTDTENTSIDYEVNAIVKSVAKPVKRVDLYWDEDAALPLAHRVPMTALDDTTYQAFIPAQTNGKVMYTIFVENTAGFYNAYQFYTFKIGADEQAPTIVNAKPLPNTLDKRGPYNCQLEVTDNQGVDTSSVWLYYGIKGSDVDSVKMRWSENNTFQAAITPTLDYGDTVAYFASARDVATTPNLFTSESYEFVVGLEDFEDPTLAAWQKSRNSWALDTTFAYSGRYSATESPGRNLGPGENHILQLKTPLDLTTSENAMLVFWTLYSFHRNKAFAYVEVSIDSGNTWQTLETISGVRRAWGSVEISLLDYVGRNDVFLRFRTESADDANSNFDGWHIDDIQIRAPIPTDVNSSGTTIEIPKEYFLMQNFPNPFNPATKIAYGIPEATHVSIRIFNLLGQHVRTLIDQKQPAGTYQLVWDGKNESGEHLTSGLYFYQIKTESFIQTRKMVWMK